MECNKVLAWKRLPRLRSGVENRERSYVGVGAELGPNNVKAVEGSALP